ncbi:hypothetical protein P154DRAFT_571134 [Amniculicola lignicola CBS 123094]|uniref:Uncharacterized protein n=1 Tax=Amniculicola lignicola CBS 123094 TaxID=1392246 RepID=A0A6A5WUB9_9PLEO|nr:hypothetical protein P154DRAFT_571134 [Amniculicola lignicola CBS 123094]
MPGLKKLDKLKRFIGHKHDDDTQKHGLEPPPSKQPFRRRSILGLLQKSQKLEGGAQEQQMPKPPLSLPPLVDTFVNSLTSETLSNFLTWFLYFEIVKLPESPADWYYSIDPMEMRAWIAVGTYMAGDYQYEQELAVFDSVCDRLYLNKWTVCQCLIRLNSPEKMEYTRLAAAITTAKEDGLSEGEMLENIEDLLRPLKRLAVFLKPTAGTIFEQWKRQIVQRLADYLAVVVLPRLPVLRGGPPVLSGKTDEEELELRHLFEATQQKRKVPRSWHNTKLAITQWPPQGGPERAYYMQYALHEPYVGPSTVPDSPGQTTSPIFTANARYSPFDFNAAMDQRGCGTNDKPSHPLSSSRALNSVLMGPTDIETHLLWLGSVHQDRVTGRPAAKVPSGTDSVPRDLATQNPTGGYLSPSPAALSQIPYQFGDLGPTGGKTSTHLEFSPWCKNIFQDLNLPTQGTTDVPESWFTMSSDSASELSRLCDNAFNEDTPARCLPRDTSILDLPVAARAPVRQLGGAGRLVRSKGKANLADAFSDFKDTDSNSASTLLSSSPIANTSSSPYRQNTSTDVSPTSNITPPSKTSSNGIKRSNEADVEAGPHNSIAEYHARQMNMSPVQRPITPYERAKWRRRSSLADPLRAASNIVRRGSFPLPLLGLGADRRDADAEDDHDDDDDDDDEGVIAYVDIARRRRQSIGNRLDDVLEKCRGKGTEMGTETAEDNMDVSVNF